MKNTLLEQIEENHKSYILKKEIKHNMQKAMECVNLENWKEAIKYSEKAKILLKKEADLIEEEHQKINGKRYKTQSKKE
jgi:hypothetical protein